MTHATSGRVGSGRIGSGRVGSGRVGSGRVGSGRFTARSLKIEQGLPKNLVWKKTTWVLITVTYILKILMTRSAGNLFGSFSSMPERERLYWEYSRERAEREGFW